MDIISHYSAYTPARTSAASQAGTKTPEVKSVPENEFLELIKKSKPADESQFPYNGSGTRARLSDTEIEKQPENLFGIADRMEVRQADDEEAKEKAELIRQLADKNSEFYINMRTQLKEQVDKNEEDQEEQAIIDALGAVLDALSGKKDVSGSKESVNKSATDLTRKIGERISKLDPDDPERIKLENMLKRLQEIGIYFDLDDMDDLWVDEDENFETLTQLLTRRQTEEINAEHPNEKEVNQLA